METSASDIPSGIRWGICLSPAAWKRFSGSALDVDELMEMENVREIVRVITPKLSEKV